MKQKIYYLFFFIVFLNSCNKEDDYLKDAINTTESQEINQASIFGAAFPVDNVSGFTLPELEENMKGVRSWNQFRDNVRSRNRQQNEIIELFANWD